MTEMSFVEAYARLKALRQHAPGGSAVPERYVAEFHHVLDLLEEASQVSLANFRIPNEVVRVVTSSDYRTGEVHSYSDGRYCLRRALLRPEPARHARRRCAHDVRDVTEQALRVNVGSRSLADEAPPTSVVGGTERHNQERDGRPLSKSHATSMVVNDSNDASWHDHDQ